MATITWTGNAGDGNFNNPANWSPMQVPGSGDNAVIAPSATSSITVTNDTVGGLSLSSKVTLDIANNSTFIVGNASASTTISNAGSLVVGSGGNSTALEINDTTVTLNGGGHLVMTDNPNNYIYGASASDTLNNVNNIISGAGQLGDGQLTLVNGASGVINANGSNTLVLNTGAMTTTNSGLIEATGTGGLVINDVVNNGTAGHITAAGGVVSLNGGTLQGGTLSSSGGGQININTGTLDGSAGAVSNTGSVQIDNNNTAYVLGTLNNTGTVTVDSTANGTVFDVASSVVTLTGAGHVVLTDNANNYIYGATATDTLDNVNNVISGAGQLGDAQLTLVNGAAGTIDATGVNNALILNTSAITTINAGLIEETGTAGLVIDSSISNTGTGHILASVGVVTLNNGTIQGGTLTSSGGGQFNINNGALDGSASAVSNNGSIQVDNNNSLYVLGTLNNTGTITIDSAANGTAFYVDSGTVTLAGGGTLATSDEGGDNYILAQVAGEVLNNVNNTLLVSGNFGDNSGLAVINSNIINNNQTHQLTLELAATLTNAKLLEETSTGGIAINSNTNVSNAGGTVAATGAGGISLNGGTITGGHLTSGVGGGFYSNGGVLDGKTLGAITTSARIQVDNNNNLYVLGTLVNSGTITLDSTANGTGFLIDSPTVTLTGNGVVTTSNEGGDNYFQALQTGDTLVNLNNQLNLSGDFGADLGLLVTNAGTINANQSNTLTLRLADTLTNTGLLEATGAGGIVVNGNTNISNAAGSISAKASAISLNGGTITGGHLSSTGTGSFYSNGGVLDGQTSGAITTSAAIQIDNNNNLFVLGTLANSGTITLASIANSTGFIIDSGTVTLTGGGVITSTDEGNDNYFEGAQAGYTLVNVNNTLDLSGNFGDGQLAFTNGGTLNANQTHALTLNLGESFINNALVEETGTGGIVVDGNTTISNGGGTIAATGTGGITLNGNATILGGILTSGTGGGFYSNGGTLNGAASAITTSAAIQVDNNNSLHVLGTLINSGTITLDSTANSTGFLIDSPTLTLTGGGVITTSDEGSDNYFQGAAAGYTLDNVNNTLNISGNFGNGQLAFINNATVNDNQTHALTLNLGESFTNNGLVEETSTGGIVIDGNTTISNGSVGTVAATGAGGIVLNGGATIAGGVLTSGAGGGFYSNGGTLNGLSNTITTSAAIQIDNNNSLFLLGGLDNTGTITLDSVANSTAFYVASPTLTLTGNGTITTSNEGYDNYFAATSSGNILDNVSNIFDLSGNFGNNSGLVVENGGVFNANQSNRLYLNTGAAFTNSGQLIASGSGGLDLRNVVLTNTSTGTIAALGGSTLVSEGGGTLTNDSSAGTLSGGTYEALANASAATLNFNGHAVVSLAANVVLSGTGSEISFGGVAIETDLTTITKTGELQVLAGRAFASKKIVTNYGTVALGGGSFKPYGFNSAPGSVVSGFGTIASKFTDNGTLTAVGGTLDLASTDTVNGAVTGTGTLAIGGATTLGTKTTLSVSNIALLSKATLDLGTSVSFAGTFNVTGAATLDGTGTFTNTGLFESTAKGVGTISAAVANSGTISVASNTTLAFSGGLANTGLILDSGTFTDTAALTGGSLSVGGTSSHATIATAVGAGNSTLATLTSAGGDLNTSGTTLTVTGDYNNTAAGTGNTYNPFKGVTGTIDANGTQLAVVGVNGTTISSVGGTLTIAIAAHGTASFVIENVGPTTDTLLRGALQTSVNGASITTKALSGSGVKAGNFGPLAGGSESGTYTIAYNGSTPLTGQAIHIASDFANVAGLTIDIVAQGAAPATLAGGSLDTGYAMPDLMVVSKG